MRRIFQILVVVLLLAGLGLTAGQNRSVDVLFDAFWGASSTVEAEKLAADVAKSGITFDEAVKRLKAGRSYPTKPAGVVMLSNRTKDGIEHHFAVNVPANYDPSRRYQLRFQLHGGVGGRENNQPRGNGEIGALAGPTEQFYVLPYSWYAAPWWSNDQVLNFDAMIDALKRTYNIDENRVVLAGVSDGGTGAYYLGMRDTTPFASFAPLNGYIMVLGNPEIEDGNIFPLNLRNKPMFVVNGGRDPLYPIQAVEPYVKHLMNNGVQIAYYPQPEAGHNTSWWPELKGTFEEFVADHPRDPDPDALDWETADLSHNRAHWLVIDKLGEQPGDPEELDDMNVLVPEAMSDFSHPMQLFERPRRPGLVQLHRKGNTIEATTKGVSAFTLLLSPDKIDFKRPVKVMVNGHETFNGRVEKNLETLMKWAARDNDRTMLYAAELKIKFGH